MAALHPLLQARCATGWKILGGFGVCWACIVGGGILRPHGVSPQAVTESLDQRLPIHLQSGSVLAAAESSTDLYGDALPPGAIGRLGSLRFRTLSRFRPESAFSADAKLIASSTFEGRLYLWDAATGKLLQRWTTKHQAKPVFTKDSKIVACAGGFWNVADGKEIKPLHGPNLFLVEGKERLPDGVLAISPDGKFHAGARGLGTIFVVDRSTGKETCTFAGHDHCLQGLAFSPQGRTLATTGEDGTIRLWEFASGKLLHTFAPLKTQNKYVRSVSFSPDGKTLIAPVGDGANQVHIGMQTWNRLVIRRWNPSAGNELDPWSTKEAEFGGILAIAPDGSTLAFDGGFGTICLWSLAKGKEIRRISDPFMRRSDSVVYAPNGKMFAAASEAGLVLWEVATGRVRKRFPRQASQVFSVAFSPNGKLLATGDASTIHVWDLIHDKEIATFRGHKGQISSLAFSQNGTILASASWDGTVRLWDVSRRKRLQRLEGHDGPVTAIAFSPDGKTLASAGFDTTALIWNMDRIRKDPRLQQK